MATEETTPKVWVGCWAAYNSGMLHGKWVDAVDEDDLWEGIQGVLKTSPEPNAEEWGFFDNDGFEGFDVGENPGVAETAKMGALIVEHGRSVAVYAANRGANPGDADFEDDYREAYQGEWDGEMEFTLNYVEDVGVLAEMPEHLQSYFDYEAYARDLFCGSYDYTDGFVFANH